MATGVCMHLAVALCGHVRDRCLIRITLSSPCVSVLCLSLWLVSCLCARECANPNARLRVRLRSMRCNRLVCAVRCRGAGDVCFSIGGTRMYDVTKKKTLRLGANVYFGEKALAVSASFSVLHTRYTILRARASALRLTDSTPTTLTRTSGPVYHCLLLGALGVQIAASFAGCVPPRSDTSLALSIGYLHTCVDTLHIRKRDCYYSTTKVSQCRRTLRSLRRGSYRPPLSAVP
jgi:hypothetical protein